MRNGEEIADEGNKIYSDADFTIGFSIKHCPKHIHTDFRDLSKIIGENSYWMTLKILMDNFKKDAMYDAIFRGLNTLEQRVQALELMRIAKDEEEDIPVTLGAGLRG